MYVPEPLLSSPHTFYVREGANLNVFAFKIWNSTCFSGNLCKQTCCHYRIRQTEKTELSIMKNIVYQIQFVGMSWLRNALFIIVRSERDLSAIVLVVKFTCIERFEEVTLIFRKYLSTLLPIILSGDRTKFAMPGPGKNESKQKSNSFRYKRVNESSRIRGQTTARVSTSVDCN